MTFIFARYYASGKIEFLYCQRTRGMVAVAPHFCLWLVGLGTFRVQAQPSLYIGRICMKKALRRATVTVKEVNVISPVQKTSLLSS